MQYKKHPQSLIRSANKFSRKIKAYWKKDSRKETSESPPESQKNNGYQIKKKK